MRLIDADALMEQRVYTVKIDGKFPYERAYKNMLHDIENAPTVDAELVTHGHWIVYKRTFNPQCSVCGAYSLKEENYCSNCGAKMDSEDIDNDKQ